MGHYTLNDRIFDQIYFNYARQISETIWRTLLNIDEYLYKIKETNSMDTVDKGINCEKTLNYYAQKEVILENSKSACEKYSMPKFDPLYLYTTFFSTILIN